jgi:hypothetical protein
MDDFMIEQEWVCEDCGAILPVTLDECQCDWDCEDEWDGQPDELTEWLDFDPDC